MRRSSITAHFDWHLFGPLLLTLSVRPYEKLESNNSITSASAAFWHLRAMTRSHHLAQRSISDADRTQWDTKRKASAVPQTHESTLLTLRHRRIFTAKWHSLLLWSSCVKADTPGYVGKEGSASRFDSIPQTLAVIRTRWQIWDDSFLPLSLSLSLHWSVWNPNHMHISSTNRFTYALKSLLFPNHTTHMHTNMLRM